MKIRWKYVLLAATVAVAVSSLLVARSQSFRVAYHKRQMQRAYDETFGGKPDVGQDGLAGFTLGESYERYEYHRQRLVELGAVRELRYNLQHIPEDAPEWDAFIEKHDVPDYRAQFMSAEPANASVE